MTEAILVGSEENHSEARLKNIIISGTPTATATPTATPTTTPTATPTPTPGPDIEAYINCLFPRLLTGDLTPRITTGDPIPRITCLKEIGIPTI